MSTSKNLRQHAAALVIERPTTASLMHAAADELEEAHARVADLQLEPAAMAAAMVLDSERIAELESKLSVVESVANRLHAVAATRVRVRDGNPQRLTQREALAYRDAARELAAALAGNTPSSGR